jgi:hypothetical protein
MLAESLLNAPVLLSVHLRRSAGACSPSKVRGVDPGPSSRRRDEGTSRGVGRAAESCERGPCGPIGLPTAAVVAVSRATRGATSRVVPRALASPGSSSRELPLLQSPTVSSPPRARMHGAPSLGSSSSSRHRRRRSTHGGVPPPSYGPPSAFLTPSTAFAHHRLAGLFHPATTSRIRLPGVFPAPQPGRLVDVPFPLVVDHRLPVGGRPSTPSPMTPPAGS